MEEEKKAEDLSIFFVFNLLCMEKMFSFFLPLQIMKKYLANLNLLLNPAPAMNG
jgi:hypothetical protein